MVFGRQWEENSAHAFSLPLSALDENATSFPSHTFAASPLSHKKKKQSFGYDFEAVVDAEQNAALGNGGGEFCFFPFFIFSFLLPVSKKTNSPHSLSLFSPPSPPHTLTNPPPTTQPHTHLQAWAASRPASSTPWPPSTSPAGATASATSTACSSRRSTRRGGSRSCLTSG